MLWTDGVTIELGAFPDGEWNEANAISAAGLVAGWGGVEGPYDMHALLWREREIHDLGFPPGRQWSAANGINASGQVVGDGFAVQANMMAAPGVPEAMADAFTSGGGPLWARIADACCAASLSEPRRSGRSAGRGGPS